MKLSGLKATYNDLLFLGSVLFVGFPDSSGNHNTLGGKQNMYMDFHTHGKLAKRLPFSTVYTDWLFGEAKGAGLDALCLTEHFNTLGFDQVYGYLLDKYHRDGDTPAYRPGTADLQ